MLFPPQPLGPLVQSWMERHRHPVSFALHIIGIPPTILGVLLIPIYLLAGSLSLFFFAAALFIGGYAIQFLGHALEGTDPGEVILLKRKLGLPYVEFAQPRKSTSGAA